MSPAVPSESPMENDVRPASHDSRDPADPFNFGTGSDERMQPQPVTTGGPTLSEPGPILLAPRPGASCECERCETQGVACAECEECTPRERRRFDLSRFAPWRRCGECERCLGDPETQFEEPRPGLASRLKFWDRDRDDGPVLSTEEIDRPSRLGFLKRERREDPFEEEFEPPRERRLDPSRLAFWKRDEPEPLAMEDEPMDEPDRSSDRPRWSFWNREPAEPVEEASATAEAERDEKPGVMGRIVESARGWSSNLGSVAAPAEPAHVPPPNSSFDILDARERPVDYLARRPVAPAPRSFSESALPVEYREPVAGNATTVRPPRMASDVVVRRPPPPARDTVIPRPRTNDVAVSPRSWAVSPPARASEPAPRVLAARKAAAPSRPAPAAPRTARPTPAAPVCVPVVVCHEPPAAWYPYCY